MIRAPFLKTTFVAFACFFHAATAGAQERLPVHNDTSVVMELWAADIPGQWNLGKMEVAPNKAKFFILGKSDQYCFLVRDNADNEYYIGWKDLRNMLRKDPDLQLKMREVMLVEQGYRLVWSRRCQKYVQIPVKKKHVRIVVDFDTSK